MQIKVSFYKSTKDVRLKLMQIGNMSCPDCSVFFWYNSSFVLD